MIPAGMPVLRAGAPVWVLTYGVSVAGTMVDQTDIPTIGGPMMVRIDIGTNDPDGRYVGVVTCGPGQVRRRVTGRAL